MVFIKTLLLFNKNNFYKKYLIFCKWSHSFTQPTQPNNITKINKEYFTQTHFWISTMLSGDWLDHTTLQVLRVIYMDLPSSAPNFSG